MIASKPSSLSWLTLQSWRGFAKALLGLPQRLFQRLSLGAKIALAPTFVTLCLMAIAAVGWLANDGLMQELHNVGEKGMTRMEKARSYQNKLNEVHLAATLSTAWTGMQREVASIQALDQRIISQADAFAKEMQAAQAEVADSGGSADKTSALAAKAEPVSDELREAMESTVEPVASYRKALDELLMVKAADPSKAASRLSMLNDAHRLMADKLAGLLRVQFEAAQTSLNKGDELATRNARVIAIGLLSALLLSGGIGWFCTRYLTSILARASAIAAKVAAGDLTAEVILPDGQSHDAIGLLLVSLEGMRAQVAEREEQVRQKTNDIQSMLQNLPQGVLTVLPGGTVHHEYSRFLEVILDTKEIAGQPLMNLVFAHSNLGADALSQVEAAVASCIGEDAINFEFNGHLLISELEITLGDGRTKSLALGWSPIVDQHDQVEKLMLCVRDVTQLKQLEVEAGAQKRQLEMIGEALGVTQEKFHEFIRSANQFIDENQAIIEANSNKNPDAIGLLFRNMHTIKGNARTYRLKRITDTVHETEQDYQQLQSDPDKEWNAPDLLARLDAVRVLVAEYVSINDETLGRKGPGRRGDVQRYVMVEKRQLADAIALASDAGADSADKAESILKRLHSLLGAFGTEKVETVLADVIESMPSLARELGKEPPAINIVDHGIVVRTQLSGVLRDVFTHALRNSLDHGLEPAEIRLAKGKPAAGKIELEVDLSDAGLHMKLRDDGAGLALGKIRRKAVDKGLITEATAAVTSADTLAALIFDSGFSTADKLTEVSGRGVGMSAVKGFVQAAGGDVSVRLLDQAEQAELRRFELVINLPGKYACVADAA